MSVLKIKINGINNRFVLTYELDGKFSLANQKNSKQTNKFSIAVFTDELIKQAHESLSENVYAQFV